MNTDIDFINIAEGDKEFVKTFAEDAMTTATSGPRASRPRLTDTS